MPRPENEKNLGADISGELFDRVDDYITKHNNPSKKQLITAMAEMWLALPENSQAILLHSPSNADSIVNLEVNAFYRLTSDEQKQAIAKANSVKPITAQVDHKKTLKDAIKMLKEMTEVERQQPGTIFRVLSPQEQKIVDEFRKMVAPIQKQKKKAKRG